MKAKWGLSVDIIQNKIWLSKQKKMGDGLVEIIGDKYDVTEDCKKAVRMIKNKKEVYHC